MKSHVAFTACTLLGLAALLCAEAPAATTVPDGGALFRQRCQGCHTMIPGQSAPLAPNLAGVVGRKAGTTSYAYSPALKAANLTWSRDSLDRFLVGPSRLVPGTRMVIIVPDPKQRAAIVDYLADTGR